MKYGRILFQRLGLIAILLICSFVIYCDKDDKPTEPAATRKLTGFVSQKYDGFIDLITGAEVKLDGFTDTTDQDGRYTITGMPPGLYQLMSTHPNYDTFKTAVEYEDGLMSYDINMTGALYSVSGNVSSVIEGNLGNAIVHIGQFYDTTDNSGNYKIDSIPQGSKTIYCVHYRHFIDSVIINISGDSTALDFQLERALYDVEGYVTHPLDGPLSGVEISLESKLATTDYSGHYSFTDISQGDKIIKWSHFRYRSDSALFTISDNHVRLDFLLTRALYDVEGYVTHNLDGPIKYADISTGNKNTISDDSGYYILHDIPIGEDTIFCSHSRFYTDSAAVVITDDHVRHDFSLSREPYALNGYVTHHIEGSIANAIIAVGSAIDTTDMSGNYSIPDNPYGTQQIHCTHFAYAPFTDDVTISTASQQYDIQLWHTVAETLLVADDATVAYLDDWDIDWLHDTTKLIDENYGENTQLKISTYEDGEMIAGTMPGGDYWSDYIRVERFFINTPQMPENISSIHLDSAILVLNMTARYYGYDCCLYIRRALEPWFEDSVTWNSAPNLSEIQDSIIFPTNGPAWIRIDLTQNYGGLYGNYYGFGFNYSFE